MRIFGITIFLGAFLLFQVEPMVAKYFLPWFGGTASVWSTCLLFFQILLLAGYAYAHIIRTNVTPRMQAVAQIGMIAVCITLMGALSFFWWSPIMPGPGWKPHPSDFPISRILLLLTVAIGLPYFILSTTGPLLQSWLAQTGGASPYRLYALSNLGSLLALVSYPFVVEPSLNLRTQANLWFVGFLAFAIGMMLCARGMWEAAMRLPMDNRLTGTADADASVSPTRATYLLWVGLAACPSLMLLSSTNQMTQEVAPIPFLWILPLALYLISFIICFDNERWYRRDVFHPALAIAIFASFIIFENGDRSVIAVSRTGLTLSRTALTMQIGAPCILLFAICMACHGELVRIKPHQRDLTVFYLMVSIGGALGGVIGAIVAPLLFPGNWEFRLTIVASTILLFIVLMRDRNSWIHENRPLLSVVLFAAAMTLPGLMGVVALSKTYIAEVVVLIAALGWVAAPKANIRAASRRGLVLQFSVAASIWLVGAAALGASIGAYRAALLMTRNFYGIITVMSNGATDPQWHAYQLLDGRIMHGEQFPDCDKRYQPVAYYGPQSGVGLVIANHPFRYQSDPKDWALRIGVLGLGAGTIAAWGQPGDYIRYYEIDPDIIKVATQPGGYFTYIGDSSARIEIIEGDARLSMEHEIATGHPQNFDVLAIDAFSGDAIPFHLLTREAMEIYLRELSPDGVIAIDISNRYIDLLPVTAALARAFKLHSAVVNDHHADHPTYEESEWVLLSRTDTVLRQPYIASHMSAIEAKRIPLWTDDYSNLFEVLR